MDDGGWMGWSGWRPVATWWGLWRWWPAERLIPLWLPLPPFVKDVIELFTAEADMTFGSRQTEVGLATKAIAAADGPP